MRKNPLLLLLLLGASFWAQSQTLHQCSGRGGTTAYRSGACLAGEQLVAVRGMDIEVAPDPTPHDATAATTSHGKSPHATRPRHARRTQAKRTPPHPRSKRRKPAVDPCTGEKRSRDDFRRRRGLKVTMAELSRWNHRVYDACK